jgi:hypothetical protein
MKEPDVMTELWDTKDRLSKEARQDIVAYCNRLTAEARKKGFMLISSILDQTERSHIRAVAESQENYGVESAH